MIKSRKNYDYKTLTIYSFLKNNKNNKINLLKQIIPIFLILENTNINIYTTNTSSKNHFYINLSNTWISCIFKLIKFEQNLTNFYIFDVTGIDTSKYTYNKFNIFNSKKNNLLINTTLYNPITYLKLSIINNINNSKKNNINSNEHLFKNLNWLERELSEFFGVKYMNKFDNRNLLLDYNDKNNYLLKNCGTENYFELYYNILNDNLTYYKSQNIIL